MRPILSRTSVLLLLSTLSMTVLMSSPVWAQAHPGALASKASPTSKDDSKTDRLNTLYTQGVAAAKAEDWPKARDLFTEALRLEPRHYQIAANLGRAEFMMNKYRDAAEHLSFFLKEAPPSVNSEERKKAQDMFEKALKAIGSITIEVNVQGAEILVDGQPVGRAPLSGPVYVEAGGRTIEARYDDYDPSRTSADVAAGSTPTIRLNLTKVKKRQDGHRTVEPEKPNKGITIAGSVIAVAALGVGAVSTAVANAAARDRDDSLPDVCKKDLAMCETDYYAAADRRLLFTRVAFGTFLGAAACGAAVATYALWPRSSSSPNGSVAFMVGSKGGGAVVTVPW